MNLIPLKANLVLCNYLSHDDCNTRVVSNEVYSIKEIINNWNDFSDEKKFKIISKYYDFRNDLDDVYTLINTSLDKNFSRIVDITTRMETEDVASSSPKQDFKYWYTLNRVHFICLATQDVKIKNKNYSYRELLGMIRDNQILPITNYEEIIEKHIKDGEPFRYIPLLDSYGISIEGLPIQTDEDGEYIKDENNNLCLYDDYYDISINEKYTPYMMKMINESYSSTDIIKGAYRYLETLLKLIRQQDDPEYQSEVKNIQKICSKNPYERSRARVKKEDNN